MKTHSDHCALRCPTCDGSGEYIENWDSEWTPCPTCKAVTSAILLGLTDDTARGTIGFDEREVHDPNASRPPCGAVEASAGARRVAKPASRGAAGRGRGLQALDNEMAPARLEPPEARSTGGSDSVNDFQNNPLRRLPRDDEGMPRYLHPGGYVIVKCKRSWSERVGAVRGQATAGPMYWWEVYPHLAPQAGDPRYHPWAHFESRCVGNYGLLADAREWCDQHPREGWGK